MKEYTTNTQASGIFKYITTEAYLKLMEDNGEREGGEIISQRYFNIHESFV